MSSLLAGVVQGLQKYLYTVGLGSWNEEAVTVSIIIPVVRWGGGRVLHQYYFSYILCRK